ncbi:hypothetical protein ACJJTC_004144 [Scirpophaga incertulas]
MKARTAYQYDGFHQMKARTAYQYDGFHQMKARTAYQYDGFHQMKARTAYQYDGFHQMKALIALFVYHLVELARYVTSSWGVRVRSRSLLSRDCTPTTGALETTHKHYSWHEPAPPGAGRGLDRIPDIDIPVTAPLPQTNPSFKLCIISLFVDIRRSHDTHMGGIAIFNIHSNQNCDNVNKSMDLYSQDVTLNHVGMY